MVSRKSYFKKKRCQKHQYNAVFLNEKDRFHSNLQGLNNSSVGKNSSIFQNIRIPLDEKYSYVENRIDWKGLINNTDRFYSSSNETHNDMHHELINEKNEMYSSSSEFIDKTLEIENQDMMAVENLIAISSITKEKRTNLNDISLTNLKNENLKSNSSYNKIKNHIWNIEKPNYQNYYADNFLDQKNSLIKSFEHKTKNEKFYSDQFLHYSLNQNKLQFNKFDSFEQKSPESLINSQKILHMRNIRSKSSEIKYTHQNKLMNQHSDFLKQSVNLNSYDKTYSQLINAKRFKNLENSEIEEFVENQNACPNKTKTNLSKRIISTLNNNSFFLNCEEEMAIKNENLTYQKYNQISYAISGRNPIQNEKCEINVKFARENSENKYKNILSQTCNSIQKYEMNEVSSNFQISENQKFLSQYYISQHNMENEMKKIVNNHEGNFANLENEKNQLQKTNIHKNYALSSITCDANLPVSVRKSTILQHAKTDANFINLNNSLNYEKNKNQKVLTNRLIMNNLQKEEDQSKGMEKNDVPIQEFLGNTNSRIMQESLNEIKKENFNIFYDTENEQKEIKLFSSVKKNLNSHYYKKLFNYNQIENISKNEDYNQSYASISTNDINQDKIAEKHKKIRIKFRNFSSKDFHKNCLSKSHQTMKQYELPFYNIDCIPKKTNISDLNRMISLLCKVELKTCHLHTDLFCLAHAEGKSGLMIKSLISLLRINQNIDSQIIGMRFLIELKAYQHEIDFDSSYWLKISDQEDPRYSSTSSTNSEISNQNDNEKSCQKGIFSTNYKINMHDLSIFNNLYHSLVSIKYLNDRKILFDGIIALTNWIHLQI